MFQVFDIHIFSVNTNEVRSKCCLSRVFGLFSTIMKIKPAVAVLGLIFLSSILALGQGTVVVNDPTKKAVEGKWSKAEEEIFLNEARPKVKKMITEDVCEESVEVAGVARGSFSKPNSKQTLIFYQYCETGNGFGRVGLVLIENNRLSGNYVADAGWTVAIGAVPDINQNGLDEFTLVYSGGLHQGQGGTGVDVMEFFGNTPKGIGWYKAEEFDETEASDAWKLTAKPGRAPVYYRQKYTSAKNNKWRRIGANTVFKLGKAYSKFTVVK